METILLSPQGVFQRGKKLYLATNVNIFFNIVDFQEDSCKINFLKLQRLLGVETQPKSPESSSLKYCFIWGRPQLIINLYKEQSILLSNQC